MNNKKVLSIFSFLLVLILIVPLVFAIQGEPANNFIDGFAEGYNAVISMLETIFSPIVGDANIEGDLKLAGEFFWMKVLFLIIVFSVVWIIVGRIPLFAGRTWISFIVSVAVSILATRFLTNPEWLRTTLLPYNVLAIAILSFIPFLIYLYFVETGVQSETGRKIAWILFAVVFFGLWLSRGPAAVGTQASAVAPLGNPGYVYLVTAIAALAMLFFDKTIHTWFLMSVIEKRGAELHRVDISEIQTQITRQRTIITNPASSAADVQAAKQEIKNLKRRIKTILST